MYLEFFQLKEKPFNVTPDPHFLYMSPSHQEAFANLLYGVRERKGFIMVTGEVGTGKTTLLHNLLNNLDDEILTVFVFHTGLEFQDLLEMIHHELGIPVQSTSKAALLQSLNRYLIEQLGEGKNVALIIDEAQNLSPEILENLRLLSNLETSKDKLLQIVLVGQPELDEKMALPQLRQLKQRITVNGLVKALSAEESQAYILHRLAVAGAGGTPIFSQEALKILVHSAEGIPRKLNVLCDNALLIAFADGNRLVGANHALEAIRDREQQATSSQKQPQTLKSDPLTPAEDYQREEVRNPRRKRLFTMTAGTLGLAALLFASYQFGTRSGLPDDFHEEGGGHVSAKAGLGTNLASEDAKPQSGDASVSESESAMNSAYEPTGDGSGQAQFSGEQDGAASISEEIEWTAGEPSAPSSSLPEKIAPAEPAVDLNRSTGTQMFTDTAPSLQQLFWSAANSEHLQDVVNMTGRKTYTVKDGEYFIGIVFENTGRQDAIVLDCIETMNPHIRDYDHIEPGWILYLPDFEGK